MSALHWLWTHPDARFDLRLERLGQVPAPEALKSPCEDGEVLPIGNADDCVDVCSDADGLVSPHVGHELKLLVIAPKFGDGPVQGSRHLLKGVCRASRPRRLSNLGSVDDGAVHPEGQREPSLCVVFADVVLNPGR